MYPGQAGTNAPKYLLLPEPDLLKAAIPFRITSVIRQILLTAAAATSTALSAQSVPARYPGAAPTCTITEVSRRPLVVEDGRELYVEPNAFAASDGGNVLLIGSPTFLIARDSSGHGTPPIVDSVMGAVIRPDGTAHTVSFPIPSSQIGYVTALGRRDGGWDVAFAELRAGWTPSRPFPTDSITRLWHGVYDGERWKSVEALPSPPDSIVKLDFATTLTRYGDSLAWALTGTTKDQYSATVVYQLRGSAWSYEMVPGAPDLAYLALGDDGRSGMQLAVVAADTSLPRPSHDSNSLFLWQQRPSWHQVRRISLGNRDGAAFEPTFQILPHHMLLTWATESGEGLELRALLDPLTSTGDPSLVARNVPFMSSIEVLSTPEGVPLWVTNHKAGPGEASEVRFHMLFGREGSMIGAIPPPSEMGFSAAAAVGTDVLLTGLRWDRPNEVVVSLLVRVSVACSAAATTDVPSSHSFQNTPKRE